MAKKILISLAIIFLSLCCGVCFATEGNSNVNLGEEITDSLDKAGDSVRNVADDAMNGVRNMTRDDTNTVRNSRENNNYGNNYNTNGTGYNAIRTSVNDTTMGTGTMSTTTWMWIILAVAAIVIVAMIWYYAVQTNNKD